MAAISFSLAELFRQTFGYTSNAFEPEFNSVEGFKSPNRAEQGAYGSPYYGIDSNGREYYLPITIKYPENSKSSQPENGQTGVLKKWDLPYPVVSISSRKTIVETALTERRGTVKELINIQDYEITVKGFIIGEGNEFPEADVTTLRNIYEQNTAISIQCPLTDIFLLRPERNGSDQVVITDLKFYEVTGIKNIRPYELRLLSDEQFNLITTSKE